MKFSTKKPTPLEVAIHQAVHPCTGIHPVYEQFYKRRTMFNPFQPMVPTNEELNSDKEMQYKNKDLNDYFNPPEIKKLREQYKKKSMTTEEWNEVAPPYKYFSKIIDTKMYLCSRDIIKNDTVYASLNDYINRSLLIVQEHAINILKENNAFKVIGEISPDATWVKEGDEFDEDNLAFIYNPAYGETEYYPITEITWKELRKSRMTKEERKYEKNPVIAIKCSQCNTFH